ncbi:MAG: M20/M25/M40 family metallo-hydrolase [Acidobacteria bacterium]|nr:M20/M25/M40 family metallo-hydrolase [Acidobacteriota bacterium]
MTTRWRRAAGISLVLASTAWQADALAQDGRAALERYVASHQRAIVLELVDLVSIPNTAADSDNIRRNAALLRDMLRRRSFTTEILETDSNPLVWGELRVPGATRTLLIWAHYDGQPVDPKAWRQANPFNPVLRAGRLEDGAKELSGLRSLDKFDPNWRLYARSASDDKAPIVALLAAVDALKASGMALSSNVRVVLDGEAGAGGLAAAFPKYRDKLTANVMLLLEGPAHPSGRPTIAFGVRGYLAMDVTVYGPKVAVNSGNYGNWVPNPALGLARLLASMKDDEGRVLVDGFYDGVGTLTAEEQAMLAAVPDEPASLMKLFGIAAPVRSDLSLQQALQLPALNIRALSSGVIGGDATLVIPDRATALLEVRLVKETPAKAMADKLMAHIGAQGYHIVHSEPDDDTRSRYPHIAKVVLRGTAGAGWRTPPLAPEAQMVTAAVTRMLGEPPVLIRTMGQRVNMAPFIEAMGAPAIVLPTVNFDNNQTAENENLRLGHLFTGILTLAAVLTM